MAFVKGIETIINTALVALKFIKSDQKIKYWLVKKPNLKIRCNFIFLSMFLKGILTIILSLSGF